MGRRGKDAFSLIKTLTLDVVTHKWEEYKKHGISQGGVEAPHQAHQP